MTWQKEGQSGKARAGWLHTRHGSVPTPTFMPVGTVGTVKGITMDSVRSTGAGIVLGNTYHLMLRPTAERVQRLGGLHRMMDWPGPILTDSGGFQVMSLGPLRKLTEDGVTFRSHIDGSKHHLTPESSTDIQFKLDATITMAFDECPALPATKEVLEASMERSMRWAARSREAFTARPGYGQFGIVQGGTEQDLRERSAKALRDIGFEGYAIGGLAVGEGQELMFSTLDYTTPMLPEDQPRYLMGVGTPDDLLGAIMRGCDMFDCVMPSRAGRTARAYTERGTMNLRNARFAEDTRPISPDDDSPMAGRYSRAYLHHLFRANEMLGPMLLTLHNLAYYQRLMRQIRAAIMDDTLEELAVTLRHNWSLGDWSEDEFPKPHY
ncbi:MULTISPECIES: tRNA guanosine(34) transglycosylase Tgt [unclassified Saccharibacter]|uniref:tRNA guanosine(34) transglycosylase Tgt n=1 Tax=unclassified Saccharibacter TaxID=2648722 RepID=UPI001322AFE3|nr:MULTISPECIES: tRNA guanosine(34) transglycosylase Tgt [unclassified Saccharibacter]MXV35128.1 tRNA guanosine(34) transglycosylase Tgt [Saccharibacter sp. EH611]MXV57325.1 tRNA guanosine(34) transglycosylase Tgt [Saccharibacter sp. EH70]MXV64814.1 tRNA guanosine(34) transglycosylase Tgt [Saccharibacter sp. EH60]